MSAPVAIPEGIVGRIYDLCQGLPEVTVRVDPSRSELRSSAHSFYIRQRPFCHLIATRTPSGRDIPLLILRAEPGEREALLSIGRPFFTPRIGRDRVGMWLTKNADWEEVRELVIDSYRVVAPKKLTALLP